MMVYKEVIRKKVLEISSDLKFADTYLNFNNMSIIPHHGKITALILVKLCKHLGLDYFVINDFDFNYNFNDKLNYESEEDFKNSDFYKLEINNIKAYNVKGEDLTERTKKAMITTNWRLVKESNVNSIHFNMFKLESVIDYDANDKNSTGIWNTIIQMNSFGEELFPSKLVSFLEIDKIKSGK